MKMGLSLCPCLCLLLLLSGAASGLADPVMKVNPTPAQGTISPSGKFTPASPIPNAAPDPLRTRDDVEALFQHVQSLKQIGTNTFQIGLVTFDKQARTITLPAIVCLRDQVIEYALVTTKGKTYESILSTEASPVDVHVAMLLLGGGSAPVLGNLNQPAQFSDTNAIGVDVSWQANDRTVTLPLGRLVCVTNSNSPAQAGDPVKPMALEQWFYNGSEFDQWGFAAQREGSFVSLIRDPSALVNNPGADRDNDQIHFPNASVLPAKGTSVRVCLRLPPPAPPPPPIHYRGQTPITPLSTNLN